MTTKGSTRGFPLFCKIANSIARTGLSSMQVSKACDLGVLNTRLVLRMMHECRIVYVESWLPGGFGAGPCQPVWRLGRADDAPHPLNRPDAHTKLTETAKSRLRWCTTFCRMIDCLMTEPSSISELEADATDDSISTAIRRAVLQLHRDKLVYISKFRRRTGRANGSPTRLFLFGVDKEDADRPKKKPIKKVYKDRRALQRRRRGMARISMAIAGRQRFDARLVHSITNP